MVYTKIPAVVGSKASRLIHQRVHHQKIINSYCVEKIPIQGFIRYRLEENPSDTDSEDDDDDINEVDNNDDSEAIATETEEGSNSNDNTFIGYPVSQIPPSIMLSLTEPCHDSKLEHKSVYKEPLMEGKYVGISNNFVDFLAQRSWGQTRNNYSSCSSEFGAHKMIYNNLYKEHVINMPSVNKIFCSQWLTDDQIIMGTKCNQLLLYNIRSHKVDFLPCLGGSRHKSPVPEQCGIHSLQLNPSRNLLATGGQNSNDIGIYRLPTLDPLCIGEQAHTDWIFDICFLDDQFFMTASRDKSLGLWKVDDYCDNCNESTCYGQISPICKKKCFGADKVRALIFNDHCMEVVALSLNARIHVWDAVSFKQVMSQRLEISHENVCLAKNDTCSLYAVGSKSHATLIDPRTLQSIQKIDTKKSSPSIRSISFRGDILTVGTGNGEVLFFDIRSGIYYDKSDGPFELNCSQCSISVEDVSPQNHTPENNLMPSAVYSHCYDCSGTRLFTAGGPLSSAYKGCYAALWF